MTAPETAPHIDVVGGRPEDAALTVSSTKERVVPFAVAALVCLVAAIVCLIMRLTNDDTTRIIPAAEVAAEYQSRGGRA